MASDTLFGVRTLLCAILAVLGANVPGETLQPASIVHLGHYDDVRAICRAGDSLWVGTGGGLFVFDLDRGDIVARMLVGDPLPSSSVRAIATRGDSVLVGTDDGLAVFTDGRCEVRTPLDPGPFTRAALKDIRRIDFGTDGAIYLSTFGRGLGVLDRDTSWTITRDDSLLDNKVYGMVQQDDTTFYFATSVGLCAYRDSAWVSFQAGAGIPRAEVRSILPSGEPGGYYLLLGGRGVYEFDGVVARRITGRDLFVEDDVSAIAVDSRGNLWASGSFGGIAVYQNHHWTRINEHDAMTNGERWRCAFADKEGGVFFGSADGLVIEIRDGILTRHRLPDGLPSGFVEVIVPDPAGGVYAIDGSYLVHVSPKADRVVVEHPSPVVVAIDVSPEQGVWCATRWGIYRREASSWIEFPVETGETSPLYTALGFDAAGNLWVATQAGNVYRYDGQLWLRMGNADEVGVGAVEALAFDRGGGVWARGDSAVAGLGPPGWTRFPPVVFGGGRVVSLSMAPDGTPVAATASAFWGFDENRRWKLLVEDNPFVGNELGDSLRPIWDPRAPEITTFGFDADGRIVVGTRDGVATVARGTTIWVSAAQGLGGQRVTSVLARGDEVWVGFRSGGLTRYTVAAGR